MSGNTGQHITVEMVVWLPAFFRFRGGHTGNFLLRSYSRLCYTVPRRGYGSRLFLVHEKFSRFSLKPGRICGKMHIYQYAILEGVKNPGRRADIDWEHMLLR